MQCGRTKWSSNKRWLSDSSREQSVSTALRTLGIAAALQMAALRTAISVHPSRGCLVAHRLMGREGGGGAYWRLQDPEPASDTDQGCSAVALPGPSSS